MKPLIHSLFVSTLSFILLPAATSACGCMDYCLSEVNKQCINRQLRARGGAIQGRVTEIAEDPANITGGDWYYTAKVKVTSSWNYGTREFVYVRTYTDNGANCGVHLKVGEEILLYARVDKDMMTSATGCDFGAPSDQKFLGKGTKPSRTR